MTGAPGFLQVSEHVARNPIGRAVARRLLAVGVRDFLIRLHLLADGELVAADGVASAKVLMVAFEVLRQRGLDGGPDAGVIRGAISAVEQLSTRGWRWRIQDAAAIDAGMQRAEVIAGAASAAEMLAAWLVIGQIERRTDAEQAGRATRGGTTNNNHPQESAA